MPSTSTMLRMNRFVSAGALLSIWMGLVPLSHADDAAGFFKDLRGQVVLVDFWASWCGPCRRSFPWMNQLLDKYGEYSFTIIAVNVDKSRQDAEEFLAETPAQFKIVYDPEGEIARAFDVQVMPSSYLLNVKGEIVDINRGFLSSKTAGYDLSIRNQLIPSKSLPGER
jgi:cytochrome c biogenesis protein CcmG/thiol:disulfide interchange protein DsbE